MVYSTTESYSIYLDENDNAYSQNFQKILTKNCATYISRTFQQNKDVYFYFL